MIVSTPKLFSPIVLKGDRPEPVPSPWFPGRGSTRVELFRKLLRVDAPDNREKKPHYYADIHARM